MTIQEVSVDDLATALETGHRVIDVREVDEYVAGHVPGATLVVLGTVADHTDVFRSPEGVTTFVICKVGGRSLKAAEFLAAHDIETVNVAGGTMAWVQSGRPVVSGDQPS